MTVTVSADAVLKAAPSHDDAAWLKDRRATARDRLERTGFPGSKTDDWKGTDVAAFLANPEPASAGEVSAADLVPFALDTPHRIVMVDGYYRADLSSIDDLPHIIHVESLAEACKRGGPVLDEHLDATPGTDAFGDWNMAAWQDGVFITTGEDIHFEAPIHILHVRTDAPGTAFPRVLIHVQATAHLSVIEHHVGLQDADTATIAVTELVAHDGATLNHDRVQQEWTSAKHMHSVRIRTDRDATIRHGTVSLGAAHSRSTVHATLQGQGSSLDLPGFFLAGGKRRTDVWTRIDHAVPHTSSDELVKGVLGDEARGAFTGNVLVRAGAQGTSAQQQNRNLLLSRKALVDAKPQLEIHADDVQCSHGSTVGQLNDDALFFLRSRGIGLEDAKVMLTKAFLGEAIERLHPVLHDYLNQQVEAWFERHPQSIEVVA